MAAFASRALRAGCLAAALFAASAGGVLAQEKVGINSAVNQQASGTPPGAATRQLVVGQDVVFNERLTTTDSGQTQLLFLDESSMTVGPNSDLTIDRFVYDPKTGTGSLAMSATKGLLRYVGGKLSKQDGAVTLKTSTATLAVRGGAFIVKIDADGKTEVVFIFGDGLTVTGLNGIAQTVSRPGFQITVKPGAPPSPPTPEPPAQLAQFVQQLDGRAGGTGGASVIPTDASVVQSGLPQTISSNLAASVQQAVQSTPSSPAPQFPNTPSPVNQSSTPVPSPAPIAPTSTVAAQPVDCAVTDSCPSGTPPAITPPPTPTPTPTPTPSVTITYAGRVKNTNGGGTANGFVDESANGDIPYTGGTLSFPQDSPQNGVFTANVGGSVGTITFPLVPGSASFQGTSSGMGNLAGTSYLSADDTFFYANITPLSQPTQRLFIFGGMPVNTAFYQPTGSTRVFAFGVQPDAALQTAIPFVPTQAGGNLPNASVSNFYLVAPPTTAIGNTATNAVTPGLQASLAINGQGANQQSTITVTTGSVGTQANGQPVFNGQMVGSAMTSASGAPVALNAAVNSTIDGNGNSFYGGNSISGFVLNQAPSTATVTPLGGPPTQNYGFAQPATPVPLPSGVGTSRTTQALAGNFGGLMFTTAQANPYIVTGGTLISTDAGNNRIQATLAGSAQTQAAGVSNLTMQYGSLSGAVGGQAFVDNNTFAAQQSLVNPQQMTINGTTSQPNGQLYLVSSGAAGTPATLLINPATGTPFTYPAGGPSAGNPVTYCQCQYLQWGYWGGTETTPAGAGSPARVDAGNINTWVAGVATPQSDLNSLISQSATANYAGHAIGSVFNNGASYVAAGGFTGTYHFGTQSGSFTISNFDILPTVTVSGPAPLIGANYSFGVNQGNVQGSVNGAFYGPMAANTGGSFAVHTTAGPTYMASGIFAGSKQ